MALTDRWLLPEGIKELLPPQARQVDLLRRKLLDLYHSWGYDLVMPPLVEHLESLLTGTGHDLDLNTFKLTDQVSGHTLGVRADITPQVARIDAHRMRTKGPSRLCYCGTVLHTHPANMLASRNPLQAGAELYGHSGVESDVEVISLMLETLNTLGVQGEITVDLGHVGVFTALVKAAGLNEDQKQDFIDILQRKALPELDQYLDALDLPVALKQKLSALPRLNGTVNALQRARELFAGAHQELEAIDYLQVLAEELGKRYPEVKLYFDLGELRGYHYHTGVVFAAYTPSFGQALAKGGRYDEIGQDFGRARPATGFSTDLNTLVNITGLSPEPEKAIFAPYGRDDALHQAIASLRAQGKRVVQALNADEVAGAGEKQLVLRDDAWAVESL
ncbi:ATP phosphoribosyltransferase regulatory subunit [Nitrincola sp. MINF-07-Sa-05]|uniref:ATP phosphoribosyltransferase regulatory subunit n=1 Tax=Nitrincola salilacus TaxID=3400273 RepID=UPI0039184AF9